MKKALLFGRFKTQTCGLKSIGVDWRHEQQLIAREAQVRCACACKSSVPEPALSQHDHLFGMSGPTGPQGPTGSCGAAGPQGPAGPLEANLASLQLMMGGPLRKSTASYKSAAEIQKKMLTRR